MQQPRWCGDRKIADLHPRDLVYSADARSLAPVPILKVATTPVVNHHVMRITTADGAEMRISPGHPTADGRLFGELRAGDSLDGTLILSSQLVAYRYSYTYDLLPASDTATYVALGKLIGSTMK